LTSPSPTSTVSVPAGVQLTDPGTQLKFGDPAAVVFDATEKRGTTLELTVKKASEGSLKDFKGFILDDPYKKKAHYYYVDVAVKNVGKGNVGGVAVPLWGVDANNVLLPAVNFTTRFPKCPSRQLPEKFTAGDSFSTCLVYLAPSRGTLTAVSFRPDQAFNPITWSGDVAPGSPTASPTASPDAPQKPTEKPNKPKGSSS